MSEHYSIWPLPPRRIGIGRRGDIARVLDFTRLPVGMQETLSLILLLPFGALLTVLFRTVGGVQTFGTFSPVLIALSFAHADWRTGLAVLLSVLALGLGGRWLLNGLRLLMVPRLGVLLTGVVLAMAIAVSVLDELGFVPSARAVILPMVILTSLVERFHVRVEEDGALAACKLLVTTLLVACLCLPILMWRDLGWFVVSFPESLLVVAGLLVLLGRYSGYRLTELLRFRDLVRERGEGHRP
jgi:hypothetical protein